MSPKFCQARHPRDLGKKALQLAEQTGRFTVFTLVDAHPALPADTNMSVDPTGDRLKGQRFAVAAQGV